MGGWPKRLSPVSLHAVIKRHLSIDTNNALDILWLPRRPSPWDLGSSKFSELRKKASNLVHLSDAPTLIEEYGAIITWERNLSREGAGQLPALLLDQGWLPSHQGTEERNSL